MTITKTELTITKTELTITKTEYFPNVCSEFFEI